MSTVERSTIRKTPGVCGGQARIHDTRVPVWVVVLHRRWGQPDEAILGNFPTLVRGDLDAAWDYFSSHPLEIERAIWLNGAAADVPEDVPPPAAVIIAGALLGLDDATLCDAFDPPLTPDVIAAAWAEYRADPPRIDRALADLRGVG